MWRLKVGSPGTRSRVCSLQQSLLSCTVAYSQTRALNSCRLRIMPSRPQEDSTPHSYFADDYKYIFHIDARTMSNYLSCYMLAFWRYVDPALLARREPPVQHSCCTPSQEQWRTQHLCQTYDPVPQQPHRPVQRLHKPSNLYASTRTCQN